MGVGSLLISKASLLIHNHPPEFSLASWIGVIANETNHVSGGYLALNPKRAVFGCEKSKSQGIKSKRSKKSHAFVKEINVQIIQYCSLHFVHTVKIRWDYSVMDWSIFGDKYEASNYDHLFAILGPSPFLGCCYRLTKNHATQNK